jgi:lipopolysaccharide/colanic/teichoic acid biosynthesis glycosyltransferase
MFICEAVLIGASHVAAVYLNRDLNPQTFLIEQSGWQSIAVSSGLIILGMYFRQLYADLRIRSRILLLQELMFVMGVAFIAQALMTYFHFGWPLPRDVLLPGSAIALASILAWRILVGPAIRNRLGLQRVLFIGFQPAAVKLAAYIGRHPEVGFAPVGYLDYGPAAVESSLAWLGSPGDLHSAIERHRPDYIVIGEKKEIGRQVNELVELRYDGVHIEDVGGFCERINGRVCATEVNPAGAIFSEKFQPERLSLKLQLLYSTVVALLAIPIALPIMGALALLIRTRSRKPALVREFRVGFCGVPFTMYRFRATPPEATGELTGFDNFVVRFGLDRLPQIWNVLRGEMSLVGPNPDRPEIAERLNRAIPFHSQRVLVRPGVIGWAEVNQLVDGSGHDAIRRLEYDLYYMKNLSPLFDLFVMLQWFRERFLFPEP